MHSTSLESLLIVVSVAFLIPILLQRLGLTVIPVVVAEIIAGIVIGNSGFDLVVENEWLNILSTFGFIYLMFLSGLEIDFEQLLSKDRKNRRAYKPLQVAVFVFIIILTSSFVLSYLLLIFGFIQEPFLMTLIISTISLGVVVPVLKEKGLLKNNLGQTLLLITVLADFITMILLAFYVALRNEEGTCNR